MKLQTFTISFRSLLKIHVSEHQTIHLVLFSTRNRSHFFLLNNRLSKWLHQIIVYLLQIHFKIFTFLHPSIFNYYTTHFAKSHSGPCTERSTLNQIKMPSRSLPLWAFPSRDAPGLCPLLSTAANSELAFVGSAGDADGLFGESAVNTILVLFPQQLVL